MHGLKYNKYKLFNKITVPYFVLKCNFEMTSPIKKDFPYKMITLP